MDSGTRRIPTTNGSLRWSSRSTAPLKHPDHSVPSGDRAMARGLKTAVIAAGYAVSTASTLRSFLAKPHAARQAEILDEAAREIEAIAARWKSMSTEARPAIWLTYHNYYKAPDLLGPTLSRCFSIPYVLAEASHAAKRAEVWGVWHEAASLATRRADTHLCLTARDKLGIASLIRPDAQVVDLPPFIDLEGLPLAGRGQRPGPVRLLTVAMMRSGDKLLSYQFLARSLAHLPDIDWQLTIVGDGPARHEVASAFTACPADRLIWRGQLPREAIVEEIAGADLFVWPGFGEAFGMAYLEAQAMGLPVVALDVAGVSSVVRHGHTGLLVPEHDPIRLAEALRTLIQQASERVRLGTGQPRWSCAANAASRGPPRLSEQRSRGLRARCRSRRHEQPVGSGRRRPGTVPVRAAPLWISGFGTMMPSRRHPLSTDSRPFVKPTGCPCCSQSFRRRRTPALPNSCKAGL